MDLIYSFDSNKWHLGPLCKKSHAWPGTGLSLRRNYNRATGCAGCTTTKKDWLHSFIDLDASGVPSGHKLGKLCGAGHSWNNTGYTLRKHRHCIECEKLRVCTESDRLRHRRYYKQNTDVLKQKARENQRRRRLTDRHGENAKAAAYKRRARLDGRLPSRSKYGLPYTPQADSETRAMRRTIRLAGRLPTVAKLVQQQQLAYWREHPTDRLTYERERAKRQARWRHMTDPSYRLYHRAKSKARKVAQRGGTPTHLSPTHLWRHWSKFDHCCAYCGCSGDLEVEHVVPISKGGEHHLGNIVPACHRCNSNKGRKDALQWYKTRTYYSEARWLKIQSVLEQSRPTEQQLALIT